MNTLVFKSLMTKPRKSTASRCRFPCATLPHRWFGGDSRQHEEPPPTYVPSSVSNRISKSPCQRLLLRANTRLCATPAGGSLGRGERSTLRRGPAQPRLNYNFTSGFAGPS